ncbi:MAG: amidohydrolase [Chloroflexi bacterium]|nr:amidohydrolase [Chloroflexota bacterium]
MLELKYISSDSHVVEEPDLWQKRIDPKFKDRAPYMVREKEQDTFYCEGQPPQNMGIIGSAGKTPEEIAKVRRFEDNPLGGYNADARLKDMDIDGVEAELLYPTLGFRMFRITDGPFQQALFRAYNDWMADLCSTHPNRMKGVGLISTYDIEGAVGELNRVKNLGMPSGMIAISPEETRPYSDPYYEPFWAAAEDLGMPIGLHILTNVGASFQQFTVEYASQANWIMRSLAALIMGGVFKRHPNLKVVSVEADIAWIPHFLKRVDHLLKRHGPRLGLELDEMPSDTFRKNVLATYIDDEPGLRMWDMIGEDVIMWSNDYPHTDSSWPNSKAIIDRDMANIPEGVQRKFLRENVSKLYGFN